MPSSRAGAQQRLMTELAGLQKENWVYISDSTAENIMKWSIALMVINSESPFNGGYFRAEMAFSEQYPFAPPKFKFLPPIVYHPNVFPSGDVCISILHKPGEDRTSGELPSERWSPLQGVESVLRSVLLLLDNPEIKSPANVDASLLFRDNRKIYEARAKRSVAESRRHIPDGFLFPTALDTGPPPSQDDPSIEFWMESDGEELETGSDMEGDEDDAAEESGYASDED